MKAEGSVKFKVVAPQGTQVTADADGMFQRTSIQRYRKRCSQATFLWRCSAG